MFEHQNNLTEARADTLVALKIAEDEHASDKKHEWKQKQTILAEASDKQNKHEATVKQFKLVGDGWLIGASSGCVVDRCGSGWVVDRSEQWMCG